MPPLYVAGFCVALFAPLAGAAQSLDTPAQPSIDRPAQPPKLPTLHIPPPRDVPWSELLDPQRDLQSSLSLGMTSNGSLQRASQLDLHGSAHHVLEPHLERDTHWGTDELVQLLLDASAIARNAWPEMRIGIGNMSRREGGRIQWSRSHQCGRDVDIAFRYLDDNGSPVDSPDLLRVDGRLRVRGHDGWTLDVPRTWAIVAALIEAAPSHIQWLFVSRPIRTALLDYADQIGAPEHTIRIATSVLHQPGDSAPHDDHLHVRIYCAQDDLIEGCDNWGPRWPHRPDYTDVATMRLRTLMNAWEQGDPQTRRSVETILGTLHLGDGAVGLAAELRESDDQLLAAIIPWLAEHHPAAALRTASMVIRQRSPDSVAWGAVVTLAEQNRDQALAMAAVDRLSAALASDAVAHDPELANALLLMLNELAPLSAMPALWRLLPPESDHPIRNDLARVLLRISAGVDIATMDEQQVHSLYENMVLDPLLHRVSQLSDAGFSIVPGRRSTWRDLLDALNDHRDWVRFNAREVLAELTRRPRPAPDASAEESIRYWRRVLQN